MQTLESPVYGESGIQLSVWTADLLWRPVGILVRFVAVARPTRGRIILMTTDLTLSPRDVIRLYGYRFKIEVSFKNALHVIGAFLYRQSTMEKMWWMIFIEMSYKFFPRYYSA